MSENNKPMFPKGSAEMNRGKADLAPAQIEAWRNFSKTVFTKGVLDPKIKQLIAVAVAHTTQCPYCIRAHTKGAMRAGASKEEIMEAVWVASEMRAGAAYAHANIAFDEMQESDK